MSKLQRFELRIDLEKDRVQWSRDNQPSLTLVPVRPTPATAAYHVSWQRTLESYESMTQPSPSPSTLTQRSDSFPLRTYCFVPIMLDSL